MRRLLIPLMLLSAQPALSQDAATGSGLTQLTERGALRRPADGFSAQLPGDFRLLTSSGGRYTVGSESVPGIMVIVPLRGMEASVAERFAENGWTDREGNLAPAGDATTMTLSYGEGISIPVLGQYMGEDVEGRAALLLAPEGNGLVVFAATTPALWPALEPHAGNLMASIQLMEPEDSEILDGWRRDLADRLLVRLDAGTAGDGMIERTDIHLCAGGNFSWRKTLERWNAPATLDSVDEGRWAVRMSASGTVELELARGNGARVLVPMEARRGQLFMDGARWYRIPARDRCP